MSQEMPNKETECGGKIGEMRGRMNRNEYRR